MDSTIIYLIALFVVGVVVGIVLGLVTDNQIISSLREENNQLRRELEEAKKTERVEIIDRSGIKAGKLFDPF